MLVFVVGLVACVLCVVSAVVLMRRNNPSSDPELTAMRRAVAADVRGRTVNEAIALLNANRPAVRVVMVDPGAEYAGPTGGFVVVFHATSGAEKVQSFDIGRNGSWIDHHF